MGRKRRHTDERIIHRLREAEIALAQGRTAKEVCKQLEVTEQTDYRWRKEYGGLKVDQAKRLRDLERENSRLMRRRASARVPVFVYFLRAGANSCRVAIGT